MAIVRRRLTPPQPYQTAGNRGLESFRKWFSLSLRRCILRRNVESAVMTDKTRLDDVCGRRDQQRHHPPRPDFSSSGARCQKYLGTQDSHPVRSISGPGRRKETRCLAKSCMSCRGIPRQGSRKGSMQCASTYLGRSLAGSLTPTVQAGQSILR